MVNPASGRGHGVRAGERAAGVFRNAGVAVEVVTAPDAGTASALMAEHVAIGTDALVVVGGDGIVHLAAGVLAGTEIPLGVIPAGTGDDLARHLGLPLSDPRAAARTVLTGETRAIDLTRAGDEYCVGIIAAGVDAAIAARAARHHWPHGRTRYVLATLVELLRCAPRRYRLELDDDVVETDAMLVAAGSLPAYGGGMHVLPDAVDDDGQIDVIIVRATTRAELLRVFPRVYSGRHTSHPSVSLHSAKRVRIDGPGLTAIADGEPVGTLPLTLQAAPGALTVITA